ncbi:hypothetical protein C1H46_026779 [Malus baccata]|uniref:DUF2828 domain-containing protein n=1 Tax=Malus baccata TaxID=106549 RepID=A0A540LMF1_MALBA|nr:hypothetical protein C1H46_026779 [Malus baccata]
MSIVEFHETLMNQVLPSAWSHNPLTTLKLICNFIDRRGDDGKRNKDEALFMVAVWLHQNHPKTLAYNLVPISSSFGHILDLPYILSQVLWDEAHLKFTGRTREEVDSNGMLCFDMTVPMSMSPESIATTRDIDGLAIGDPCVHKRAALINLVVSVSSNSVNLESTSPRV